MDSKTIRYNNVRSLVDSVGGVSNFASRLDKGQSQVSQFAGTNPIKGIGNKVARQIEEAFGKPHGWLDIPHSEEKVQQVKFDNNVDLKSIRRAPDLLPVLSWVQAGNWTTVDAVNLEDVQEWLPPLDDSCHKCFYLRVQGLSNYPTFIEGDYILVDPMVQYDQMQSGDIIVVHCDGDATFKKLVIEPDNTRYLQAMNPDFRPNIIPITENCVFVGQVIDCVRQVYSAKRRTRKH